MNFPQNKILGLRNLIGAGAPIFARTGKKLLTDRAMPGNYNEADKRMTEVKPWKRSTDFPLRSARL